jgi:O-antigen ligase
MLSISLGGIISSFLFVPSSSFGIFVRISQNFKQDNIDAISSGRIELWKTAIFYILERPFIGYGFLPHKQLEAFRAAPTHNVILDFWLWFGLLVGTLLAAFPFLLWIIVFKFFRKANDPFVSALFV